jgi:hypothetical protein
MNLLYFCNYFPFEDTHDMNRAFKIDSSEDFILCAFLFFFFYISPLREKPELQDLCQVWFELAQ